MRKWDFWPETPFDPTPFVQRLRPKNENRKIISTEKKCSQKKIYFILKINFAKLLALPLHTESK